MRNSVVFALLVLMACLTLLSACDKRTAQPAAPAATPLPAPQTAAPPVNTPAIPADQTAQSAVKPYPLNVCIVSDEELDSMGKPISLVYQGQEFKFCCDSCPAKFNKDPQKYVAKLQAAVAAKASSTGQSPNPAPIQSP